MADYYPLLAKAILALDPNTVETRGAIYDRARAALQRRLESLDATDPSLGKRELARLEEVIARLESEATAEDPTQLPAATEPTTVEPVDPIGEQQRPQVVPRAAAQTPHRKPLVAVAASIGLIVVSTVATVAYLRRNEPPATTNRTLSRPTASVESVVQPAKPADRIGQPASPLAPTTAPPQPNAPVVAAAPPPAPPRTPAAPVQAPPPAPLAPSAPPAAASAPPAVLIANRALLLLQAPDQPESVVVRAGNVTWRLEASSGGQGQPLEQVIIATVDVSDSKLRAEITIRRNRDPAFPASHTVNVQFRPDSGSETGAIRELAAVEMRDEPNQPGLRLSGQGIAVTENLFLLALTMAEPALSRNIEGLLRRRHLYIEFVSAAGRRGAVVLEKGIGGQQTFEDAIRQWQ